VLLFFFEIRSSGIPKEKEDQSSDKLGYIVSVNLSGPDICIWPCRCILDVKWVFPSHCDAFYYSKNQQIYW
jgi:hypothetical protein